MRGRFYAKNKKPSGKNDNRNEIKIVNGEAQLTVCIPVILWYAKVQHRTYTYLQYPFGNTTGISVPMTIPS